MKRFYIVDRGVDNNNDPNAVDGKLYELTTPPAGPPANLPPVVDAGSDQSVALPASASLDGTVTDDGTARRRSRPRGRRSAARAP